MMNELKNVLETIKKTNFDSKKETTEALIEIVNILDSNKYLKKNSRW